MILVKENGVLTTTDFVIEGGTGFFTLNGVEINVNDLDLPVSFSESGTDSYELEVQDGWLAGQLQAGQGTVSRYSTSQIEAGSRTTASGTTSNSLLPRIYGGYGKARLTGTVTGEGDIQEHIIDLTKTKYPFILEPRGTLAGDTITLEPIGTGSVIFLGSTT